jgi:hypothetical protein
MAKKNRFRVGEQVRFRFGLRDVDAVVTEDRGPLGINGKRIYGVRFKPDPESEEWYTEVPAEDLVRVTEDSPQK